MNRKEYEKKLNKWEAEGYDVSELREKWFPAKKSHIVRWLLIAIAAFIVVSVGLTWQVWPASPLATFTAPPPAPEPAPTPAPEPAPAPPPTPEPVPPPTPAPAPEPTPTAAPLPLPPPQQVPGGVYHLTAYSYTPSYDRINNAMRYTMKLITERANGRMAFDFQEAGTLFGPPETYDAVCRRDVDIAFLPQYYNVSLTPSSLLFQIPGLIDDTYIMQRGLDEGVAKLIRREWDAGEGTAISFFPLLCYDIGTASHSQVITSPDDLEGLKIRTVHDVASQLLELCGAMPVSMPPTDVYTALERGVIDGHLVSPETFNTFKLHEVTKYYTWIHLMYDLAAIFSNKEALNGLPPDLREILLDAWENDYLTYYSKLMEEDHAEAKKIAQRDCVLHQVTPAGRRIWYDKLAEPIVNWLIKEKKAEPEILREAINIYKKYW